jgi:hypothetical protein
MRERIFDAARRAGPDPAEITLVYNMQFRLDGGADGSPQVVSASGDHVVGRVMSFIALGFTAMNLIAAVPNRRHRSSVWCRRYCRSCATSSEVVSGP